MIETWSAHRTMVELETLCALEYPGGSPHARETVDLCRRLIGSGPASDVTLLYVHRGHHCQCKTPLLQTLLVNLPPQLQVHGLRVEQEQLPLDTVLFAIGVLERCDRCVIVKDNADDVKKVHAYVDHIVKERARRSKVWSDFLGAVKATKDEA